MLPSPSIALSDPLKSNAKSAGKFHGVTRISSLLIQPQSGIPLPFLSSPLYSERSRADFHWHYRYKCVLSRYYLHKLSRTLLAMQVLLIPVGVLQKVLCEKNRRLSEKGKECSPLSLRHWDSRCYAVLSSGLKRVGIKPVLMLGWSGNVLRTIKIMDTFSHTGPQEKLTLHINLHLTPKQE